jgi:hypothetical protein
MIWIVCFIAAVCCLAFSLFVAVMKGMGRYRRGRLLTPFNTVFMGVFIFVLLCMFPIYYCKLSGTAYCISKAVAFAIHNTLQVFTIDVDRAEVIADIVCPYENFATVYSVFVSVALVIAPIMTFGFLISVFRNASANFRYTLCFFRDAYVFSELNEKSLALGRDLRKNHKRAAIVYTNVSDKNDESTDDLIESARELKAICFKKDILAVNFARHSKNAEIVFFTINIDETDTVDSSLKLIERYSDRENTKLLLFSTGIISQLVLPKATKKTENGKDVKIKVRRVDEVRSLICRLLYDNGYELFESAKPAEDAAKKISAVIVGLGRHGTQMLKALSWYCQMDGYSLEINAFDLDEKAKERFCSLAPELMDEKHNGVYVEGDAQYKINIHSGVDVTTKHFDDEISKIRDATYVFVSLGNDATNINAAVKLRMLFERMNTKPIIKSVVYSTDEKKALEGAELFNGKQTYDIDFIGDIASSYSEDVVLNSELEADALNRHLKWGDEDSFWRYEYNYNSSVASAIHMKARIACKIAGADKKTQELTEKERDCIEVLEHRRWNAYIRSEGYVFSGSTDKNSRNDLGKMHHDLIPFKLLSKEEKRKDSNVGTQ